MQNPTRPTAPHTPCSVPHAQERLTTRLAVHHATCSVPRALQLPTRPAAHHTPCSVPRTLQPHTLEPHTLERPTRPVAPHTTCSAARALQRSTRSAAPPTHWSVPHTQPHASSSATLADTRRAATVYGPRIVAFVRGRGAFSLPVVDREGMNTAFSLQLQIAAAECSCRLQLQIAAIKARPRATVWGNVQQSRNCNSHMIPDKSQPALKRILHVRACQTIRKPGLPRLARASPGEPGQARASPGEPGRVRPPGIAARLTTLKGLSVGVW